MPLIILNEKQIDEFIVKCNPYLCFFVRYEAQNTEFALEHWVKNGADRSKLVMGIPFYGQTFLLANSFQNGLNAPVTGPGEAGPITLQKGMLSYMELCQKGKL